MLHISDIKKFIHCPRLYYYDLDANNEFNQYLRNDLSINDLLIEYFHIDSYYLGERNDLSDRFINNINNYEWFIRPRLNDGELRINIPLVKRNNNEFDLYFINYGTSIKELDTLAYSIYLQIFTKYQLNVNDIYIIYLNGEYVNQGTLDVSKLFLITDTFHDEKIIDKVIEKKFDYKEIVDEILNNNLNNYPAIKNRYCRLFGECSHYDLCFENEKQDCLDSILYLASSQNKVKMYEDGIRHLKDADLNLIEGNRVQYAQIMASRNNGLFVDKYALKKFLKPLNERPISFIDFEWDRYLIPEYKGMKPMDVVCFEFALYVLDENDELKHYTFVETKDCREKFVEELIKCLPSEGPILAYNALGAECLRLQELADLFPQYKEQLYSIVSRFYDLATPFIDGIVYDIKMAGNFTLKKLVDICSDYSYSNLDIYDGMQAVYNWRNLDKGQINEKTLSDLKEYCSLDAYGLYLVYNWLLSLL